VRPLVPRQVVRESLYAFAAVEPQNARLAWGLWPKCNTASMSLFLLELLAVWPDRQLLLILDGAGWHKARALPVPERLRLLHLPPYCPECNPTEHIWDEVREKGFANRYFATLDAVEVGLKTQLTLLTADTARLRSLTLFPWVREGLLYV
jgi:transposase